MDKPSADINKPHDQLNIGNPLHQNECIRHQIVCNHMIDALTTDASKGAQSLHQQRRARGAADGLLPNINLKPASTVSSRAKWFKY
jgi:hypothetical protein